jgi:hypothetical protein
MKSNIFEKVLNNISLDPRIKDGMFSIEQNEHMDVLREYLAKKGIEESSIIEFANKVVEGKYPERQAYNAKGILVTFPTPEYKKAAIDRGTHFEEDPTKRQSNLFQQQPQTQAPSDTPKKAEKEPEAKTNLPLSQSSSDTPPASEEPTDTKGPAEQPAAPPPQAPATDAAPQQTEEPKEPAPEPTQLPPPAAKSPEEKQADAKIIKQMLTGDSYKLESVVDFLRENLSPRAYNELMQRIQNI